jgi:hypothetical protein
MSGSDDNFLARWSRRKEAVKAVEESPPEKAEGWVEAVSPRPATGAEDRAQHGGGGDDERGALASAPSPSEPAVADASGRDSAEPAEPLPRIEDLTAESDLSAFMRRGVPEALKAAALRRMWSLDPAIRDYVGPAEYAWDFNNPGTMAGFGPVGSHASIRTALPSFSGSASASPEEQVASAPTIPLTEDQRPRHGPADSLPAEQPSADGNHARSDSAAGPTGSEPDADAAHPSRTAEEAGESRRPPTSPRHGGALPR